MEQIRRVFEDNLGIIFISSPEKHMLWVLIRITYPNEYPQHMFLWRQRDSNEYPQHMFLWRRGDSNEYPQHKFLSRNKQNYPLIVTSYPPCQFCSTENVELSHFWDLVKQCRPISDTASDQGLQCLLTGISSRSKIKMKTDTSKFEMDSSS